MRVSFRARYHTHPGESLSLTGPDELFGGGDPAKALQMDYLDSHHWQARMYIPQSALPDRDLSYDFLLTGADGNSTQDWGKGRSLNLRDLGCEDLVVIDSWNNSGFIENAFLTEPFQEVLLSHRKSVPESPAPAVTTHRFRVKAPLLHSHQALCLVGGADAIGNWSTANPLLLSGAEGKPYLEARVDLRSATFPVPYKYGIYDLELKRFADFETGSDRVLTEGVGAGKLTIVEDGFARFPATTWKGAGVAVPVFSLRSETGFGVGEFNDLKKLADWCAAVGLKLIQILPVNDTTATHTWTDSYPYAAISAFALHPLYLNLHAIADPKSKTYLLEQEAERQRLNALPTVDYEAVMKAKLQLLHSIFEQQKERTFRTKEYREFFDLNRDWLVPYALFCYLREQYGTADFTRWPAHRQYVDPAASSQQESKPADRSTSADPIAFHYFVQFHLHRQLADAARYAHSKGIILKGDIPIGVYRYGADAWQAPDLYRMDMQAGAPPDAFGVKGQNWGFPTYNWPRMKETGYRWWKRRFEQMSRYFDAFRIDHVLGFFRIWSVPLDAVEGILGRFVPALPVTPDEFGRRGINYLPARYLSPYITDQVITHTFGAQAERIKREFLVEDRPESFSLKAEFATQRQVEAHFANLPATPENTAALEGLFDLISNVLLFEEPGSSGKRLHFRFGIEKTLSFQALNADTRSRLWDLYIDYFFRRQENFWRQQGMEKLPALKRATNMLVCGEDLGLVPACVPDVMRELGLLSLEIQRMPKVLNQDFSRPSEAPYLSVVTPSTHDMSTIRGWWNEDRVVTQKFYNQELGRSGQAPTECGVEIVQQIVQQHLASPAMWSIFQLQDLLGVDEHFRSPDPEAERINVPANPKNYWRYRMHLPLEKLSEADALIGWLRSELASRGR